MKAAFSASSVAIVNFNYTFSWFDIIHSVRCACKNSCVLTHARSRIEIMNKLVPSYIVGR